MWQDARAVYDAGRVRVTEVRASDFLGAGAVSPFTIMVGAAVLTGSPVSYPGDLDAQPSVGTRRTRSVRPSATRSARAASGRSECR
ncbi:hypothetical protein Msi02_16210 [Microbispora siamensis]|uniref:Uncharacterized protein n=1 Tax=Microbispora siamensis TaxID=564413 RepID=A0ABQ4GHD5_9ACTN|nr:hypothetical protein Msi02_16210 [Microbispora siamensis]